MFRLDVFHGFVLGFLGVFKDVFDLWFSSFIWVTFEGFWLFLGVHRLVPGFAFRVICLSLGPC